MEQLESKVVSFLRQLVKHAPPQTNRTHSDHNVTPWCVSGSETEAVSAGLFHVLAQEREDVIRSIKALILPQQ